VGELIVDLITSLDGYASACFARVSHRTSECPSEAPFGLLCAPNLLIRCGEAMSLSASPAAPIHEPAIVSSRRRRRGDDDERKRPKDVDAQAARIAEIGHASSGLQARYLQARYLCLDV